MVLWGRPDAPMLPYPGRMHFGKGFIARLRAHFSDATFCRFDNLTLLIIVKKMFLKYLTQDTGRGRSTEFVVETYIH
jgi:hypothetical protein